VWDVRESEGGPGDAAWAGSGVETIVASSDADMKMAVVESLTGTRIAAGTNGSTAARCVHPSAIAVIRSSLAAGACPWQLRSAGRTKDLDGGVTQNSRSHTTLAAGTPLRMNMRIAIGTLGTLLVNERHPTILRCHVMQPRATSMDAAPR